MAQVGSLKLIGATSDTSQSCQEQPASQVSQPKDDGKELVEQVSQQSQNLTDKTTPESDVTMDDDDVQLVLSVPRRRRKKKRRLVFSNSPLGQYQETQAFSKETKEETNPNDSSARRKSTSVVQRLESCHLGEREAGQRRGSLPTVPVSVNTPIQQLTWTHEPNCNHHQFPIFPMAMPWWDDTATTLPHGQMPSSNWLPWQPEDGTGKKRKLEDGLQDNGPRKHYRQSTQISPRSNPASMIGPRFNPQQQLNTGMSGSFDRHRSDHSTNLSWPTFDWEPYRVVNPQYASPYTPPSIAMDITESDNGSMSQHQPPFQGWTQHAGMFSHDFDPDQGNCDMFPPNQRPVPQAMALPARYSMQCSPSSPVQQPMPRPMSASRIQTPQPPTPSPNCIVTAARPHFEVSTVATPSNTTPTPATPAATQFINQAPNPSDVLRRPSLYKIPAWPTTPAAPAHSSPASPVVPPSAINSNAINPDSNRRTASQVTAQSTNAQQLPNEAQTARTTCPGIVGRVNESASPSPPPTPHDRPMAKSTEEFQIPRARAGRKYSPNLIVDIAETCQEVFPFTAVAERHGVPLQKVFDTFSGVIQLPLLRNADDRRRHGSLGKRRMKEYRDARKAMERAQEAERKAEVRAMRARVDEAARKSQGSAGNVSSNVDGKGLLKVAIMNSAGKT